MKHFVLSLLAVLSLVATAETKNSPDIFPPIIPQNILKAYLKASYKYTDTASTNMQIYVDRQDAATLTAAKAYTDSKSVSGDITALSNRVVKAEGDIVVVSNNTAVAQGVADAALLKANNPPVLSINGKTGVVSVVEGPSAYVRTVDGATGDVVSVAFKPFDASWTNTNCTIDEFLNSVWVTGKKPTVGSCYLGQFRFMTPGPTKWLENDWYEVIMEVPVENVCLFRATSTSTAPYFWRGFSGTDNHFNGWNNDVAAKLPTSSGTYYAQLTSTVDSQGKTTSSNLKWSTLPASVTSFNGNTGAVTYTAPVTSVNGETGAVTTKAFLPFNSSWKNSGTTIEEFFQSVEQTNPDAGSCFLGGFYGITPGPCAILQSGNYEVVLEVPVEGVYTVRATSTTTAPYMWEGTWGGSFSGWKQIFNAPCPTTSGTYFAKLTCTVNSSGLATSANISWDKITNEPSEDGTYVLKLTKSGSTVSYTWVKE